MSTKYKLGANLQGPFLPRFYSSKQGDIIWTEKNEILIYAATLMNTENIVLKERH